MNDALPYRLFVEVFSRETCVNDLSFRLRAAPSLPATCPNHFETWWRSHYRYTPTFVAGSAGRIDVDALDFASVPRQ